MFPSSFHPSQDEDLLQQQPQPDHDHVHPSTNPRDLLHFQIDHHTYTGFSLTSSYHGRQEIEMQGLQLGVHDDAQYLQHPIPKHKPSPKHTYPFTSASQQSHMFDIIGGSNIGRFEEEKNKKKAQHREIERQRRKEMNTLYASLRSLLPAQLLKGKRAVSDQLNAALDHINRLQRSIKQLEIKRAEIKSTCREDAGVTPPSYSIIVQPYSNGVEVVVHSGHRCRGCGERPMPLSRLINLLQGEGLNIVCCATTKVNEANVYTIHSEACDSSVTLDIPRLQSMLNELLSIH